MQDLKLKREGEGAEHNTTVTLARRYS